MKNEKILPILQGFDFTVTSISLVILLVFTGPRFVYEPAQPIFSTYLGFRIGVVLVLYIFHAILVNIVPSLKTSVILRTLRALLGIGTIVFYIVLSQYTPATDTHFWGPIVIIFVVGICTLAGSTLGQQESPGDCSKT